MQENLYVKLAREAILSAYEHRPIDYDSYLHADPSLGEQGAAFVTLNSHGHLRGCIGSIIAHRPLIEDIVHNARSAAFHDPRFNPLEKSEYPDLDVEVSILTPPRMVDYRDTDELRHIIRPGIDGVIIRQGHYQATFLPQVWDELNDFESFFAHLGLKAGIGRDPLAYHPEVYTYQVQKYV